MNIKIKREAWIHEAFSALADAGVEGIKVESLAKRLKVTKGGFYWHFKNRNELLDELLQHWQQGRVDTISQQVDSDKPATEILSYLLDIYTDQTNPRGKAIELAVRDWARNSEQVGTIVKAVDKVRLEAVAGLFLRLGLNSGEAFSRAYLFYSYVFGQSLLNFDGKPSDVEQIKAHCEQFLIPSC